MYVCVHVYLLTPVWSEILHYLVCYDNVHVHVCDLPHCRWSSCTLPSYPVNVSWTVTITGKFFPFASCQQLTSYVAFLAEHVHSRQPPCIVIVYAICLLWPRNCCRTTVADRALNRRDPRPQPPDINRTVRFSIRHDTVAISRCTPIGCPRV